MEFKGCFQEEEKGIAKVAVTPSNSSLSDLTQPTSLYDNTDTSLYESNETHVTADEEHKRTPKVSNDKLPINTPIITVSGSSCPTHLAVTEGNATTDLCSVMMHVKVGLTNIFCLSDFYWDVAIILFGGNISINATVRICSGGILTLFVNDYKLSQPCTNLRSK